MHGKDWRQHAGSPSAGGREWEGRQTSMGARCQWARQVGLSAAAAGWQIVSVAEIAYTTTAFHFPGLPSTI